MRHEEATCIEIKRILCPIDFSDFSRHALDYAMAFARWYRAEITALHVFTPLPPPGPAFAEYPYPMALEPPNEERLREELSTFVEPTREAGIATSIVVKQGEGVAPVLDLAETLPADLLVMGTHGRGGFERLVLGSFAEKVLRKATCPVLTIPRGATDPAASVPVLLQRILCPIDFSPSSTKALTYALSLAQESAASLTLVHVLEALDAFDVPSDYIAFTLDEYRRHMAQSAAEKLQASVPPDVRNWCAVQEIVATGKAYREILRIAGEQDAHVIVMGTQGRSAVDLMLFGSSTNHVVREATCPVLTLRGGATETATSSAD